MNSDDTPLFTPSRPACCDLSNEEMSDALTESMTPVMDSIDTEEQWTQARVMVIQYKERHAKIKKNGKY